MTEPRTLAQMLGAWSDVAAPLFPTHSDRIEPVRRAINSATSLDEQEVWRNLTWIGRRSRPRVKVDRIAGVHRHSSIHIDVASDRIEDARLLVDLVVAWSSVLAPDYASVHRLTSAERDHALVQRRPDALLVNRHTSEIALAPGIPVQLERNGLPTLYWINVFGPSYVTLFGDACLETTPSYRVQKEPFGYVIQLTEQPPAPETTDEFDRARQTAIDHLGATAFWPNATRRPTGLDTEPAELV